MRSSKILVSDLDHTLTKGGEDRIKPQVKCCLISAKESGWTLILATGRDRRYLLKRDDVQGLFDAWVLELGIAVYLPQKGHYRCYAPNWWREKISRLASLPFVKKKENTIVFKAEYLDRVRAEAERLGISGVFNDNRGTVLLLPDGGDKAFGVRKALELLGVTGYVIAIGDSEVDLELLRFADFGIAVANADQPLKEVAGYITEGGDGEGVIEAIEYLNRFGR